MLTRENYSPRGYHIELTRAGRPFGYWLSVDSMIEDLHTFALEPGDRIDVHGKPAPKLRLVK